jgi:hypothetical protein
MTEASQEISRHRVKAADTGLRADWPPDAAYNVVAAYIDRGQPWSAFDSQL